MMTVLLLWHVQNFVVIDLIYFEQDYKVSLKFKFYRNIVNGRGARGGGYTCQIACRFKESNSYF